MSLTKLSTLAVLTSVSSLLAQGPLPAPANDLCANAQVVTLGTFSGDNTGATLDPSTPAWTIGNGVTGDVFFEYTATFDGAVTIDFCASAGTHTDTEIEVFDGGCGALNLVASNADGCAGSYLSTVTFSGLTGTVYTFRVGGWGGEEGSFDGVISAAPAGPANDDCSGALALVLGPQSGDNTNATVNAASDPAWTIGNGVTADVWYQYTPSVDAPLSLTSCGSAGSLTDTVFEVFTGSCGALSLLAANDDGCGIPGDYLSTVDWFGQAGVTYSIRVGGWGGASGTYDLALSYGSFGQTVSLNGGDESTSDFQFGAGDTITTRYYEASQGSFVVQTLNVGADATAVGSTPVIPGFEQTWAGSTPAGTLLDFPAVLMLNGASNSLTIPPSIALFLAAGDQVRLQPLYLDFVSTPLPVIAANAINGTYFPVVTPIAGTEEGFESGAPAGWVDNGAAPGTAPGGGQVAWAFGSFTPSGGTGPQGGAYEGTEFMYSEGSGAPPYGFTYEITTTSQSGGTGVGFAVNATGTAIGTLNVSVDDGNGPQVIYTLTGANGDWSPVLAALPAGLGSSYTVTFSYTAGAFWSSDIGIDDFYIYQ